MVALAGEAGRGRRHAIAGIGQGTQPLEPAVPQHQERRQREEDRQQREQHAHARGGAELVNAAGLADHQGQECERGGERPDHHRGAGAGEHLGDGVLQRRAARGLLLEARDDVDREIDAQAQEHQHHHRRDDVEPAVE